MEITEDILEMLEQHWDRVDEIADRSRVQVVRWRLPESRRRWVRSLTASIMVAAAIAAVIVITIPRPDGFYSSNLSNRSEALVCINQMRTEIQ